MKFFVILLFSSIRIGLSTFGLYDFKDHRLTGMLKPSANLNLTFQDFRFYSDLGLKVIKTEDSLNSEWKLYQCYLKYQKNNLEIKGGKILFIPGFAGLFNPFFNKPAFETVETDLEGKKGVFLRFTSRVATPTLFATFDSLTYNLKAQLCRSLSKYEIGIYSEFSKQVNLGAFVGYFGSQVVKIQGFLEDSLLKLSANIEFPVRSTLISIWYSHRSQPEFTVIPIAYLLTRNLLALEIKFPEKIFEIPYFLVFYDSDNKTLALLLDYRYVMGNNFLLETGFTSSINKGNLNYAIYGGFKLTKGF